MREEEKEEKDTSKTKVKRDIERKQRGTRDDSVMFIYSFLLCLIVCFFFFSYIQ
jgi:hypothetical protein